MRKWIYLLIFLVYVSFVSAAPSITSASGSFVNGGSVSISGNGFGVKSPVEPLYFDNFEAGNPGSTVRNSNPYVGVYTWDNTNDEVIFDTSRSHGGSKSSFLDILNDGQYVGFRGKGPYEKLYISWWKYHEASPGVVLNGEFCTDPISYGHPDYNPDHCHNHKMMYLFANAQCTNAPSVYDCPQLMIGAILMSRQNWQHGIQGGDCDIRGCDEDVFFSWTKNVHFTETLNEWQRWDNYVQVENPYNTDNGVFQAWFKGGILRDNDAVDYNYLPFGWDDLRIGAPVMRPKFMYDTFQAWLDDFYVDNTRARIEICDQAVWDDSVERHCEIQIPRSGWDDGTGRNIGFEVNLGSFTGNEDLYLYVIDENGAVSNGFLIGSDPLPAIDSVTGSLIHGNTMSIVGSDFGVKSPVEPMLWDTVDNQASYTGLSEGDMIPVRNDGCANCPWNDNIPDSWGMPPYYSEVDMRASHPNYRVFGKGYFRGPSDWDVTDDIIVNYWMKVDATPGYYDGSNGNFKFIRLYADSGGFSSNGGVTCSTTLCSYTSDEALNSNTVWRSWGGNVPDVWHHIEITADDHGDYSSGNGEFNFYVDNRPIFQFTDVYANSPLKLFWILGFDSLDDWHTYLEDASMDWTEIYVDNTLAKIAIGDAPVWSEVSHWEVQIPKNTWNDNNIEFEVNLGSFTQQDIDEDLYLFVIDENGEISNGYCLNPSGCTYVPPIPHCGDGVVNQLSEECDGSDLDGGSCLTEGYDAGTISCTVSCTYNTGACIDGCLGPEDCNDDNECTLDVCNNYLCSNTPTNEDLICDDGVSCTPTSTCQEGSCTPTSLDHDACIIGNGCEISVCTTYGCAYDNCPIPQPIFHQKFDGNTNDEYGKTITPINGGVTNYVDGKIAQAAVFDGGYLTAGTWNIPGNELTITAWVYFDSLNPSGTRIISKASGDAENLHTWMLGEYGGNWRSRLNGDTLGPSGSFSNGVWHHVATTYDGNTWKNYLNGTMISSKSKTGDIARDSKTIAIGANPDAYGLITGKIDDLRIYDVALSEEEINSIKLGMISPPPPPPPPPPILAFDFNNDQEVDILDLLIIATDFGGNSVHDTDNNNKINILDLLTVINNFT